MMAFEDVEDVSLLERESGARWPIRLGVLGATASVLALVALLKTSAQPTRASSEDVVGPF